MAAGTLLFITAMTHFLTIPATLIMGMCGGLSIISILAALVDKYPVQNAVAVAEAMVAISASAVVSPLLVGGLESAGIGWRSALLVGVVALIVVFGIYHAEPVPPAISQAETRHTIHMPRQFWIFIFLIVLVSAVQWCMIYWAADFLDVVVRLGSELSSALISLFFAAVVIGRWLGSRLARTMTTNQVLILAVSVAMVGFPLFWLAQSAPLNVLGLFISGLGMGNLFPMTMAAGIAVVPGQTDAASGRLTTASGVAIIIIPQILGGLADQVGIKSAYTLVLVLLILTIMTILLVSRQSKNTVQSVT